MRARLLLVPIAAALVTATVPAPSAAQEAPPRPTRAQPTAARDSALVFPPASRRCLAALPADSLVEHQLYLVGGTADTTRAARDRADSLTAAVAARWRARSTRGSGGAPAALAGWLAMDALVVRVDLLGGGRSRSTPVRPSWAGPADSALWHPAAESLDAVSGTPRAGLPPARLATTASSPTADSLRVTLSVVRRRPAADTATRRGWLPLGVTWAPIDVSPRLTRPIRVEYPELARSEDVDGAVRLAFVVDVDGAPVVATLAPATPARPDHRYAPLFEAAALAAVRGARFTPGTLGGCAVPRLVELPIRFQMARD